MLFFNTIWAHFFGVIYRDNAIPRKIFFYYNDGKKLFYSYNKRVYICLYVNYVYLDDIIRNLILLRLQ